MGVLDNKVAVVTGGGRGIGRAVCLALAEQGAAVVVNDLGANLEGEGADAGPADEVVREIVATGGRAVADTNDVSTMDGAAAMVRRASDSFGRIDALIACAGNASTASFLEMTEEQFDRSVAVHLKGQFACGQAAAREMVKQGGGGRIVLITSHVGLYGHPDSANYASAKAGVTGLVRSACQSLAGTGVTVNAIAPSAVTRMSDTVPVDVLQARAEAVGMALPEGLSDDQIRMMLIGDPAAVGNFAAWLCSDATADVTGEIFAVIGGHIGRFAPWSEVATLDSPQPWSVEELAAKAPRELLGQA